MIINQLKTTIFILSLIGFNIIYSQTPLRILEFPDGTSYVPKETEIFSVYSNKDGKYSIDYTLDLNKKDTIIVEFYEKPLCLSKVSNFLGKQILIEDEHQSFKNLLQSSALAKSSNIKYDTDYSITHEFHKVFNGMTIECTQGLRRKIQTFPMVKKIYDEGTCKTNLYESVKQIKADKVRENLGYTGKGVTVGIIDTGIEYTHPAFGNGFESDYKVIGGYDFANDDNDPVDDNGHGTHVAGIVAGKCDSIIGVAPDANLLAVKVLNSNGYGSNSDVIAGIEYCYDPDGNPNTDDAVDIINMSLGGSRTTPSALDSVVNYISKAGVLCVIAAGNSGNDYATIESPGAAQEALTVGACDSDFEVASFSSRGLDPIYDLLKPEVVAPGVDIYSSELNGTYERYSGTSMATPHVAGVAALIKEKYPDLSSADIKSLIINNTKALTNEEVYGAGNGCVDALQAIEDSLIINPGTISFGFADSRLSEWRDTVNIVIKNHYNYTQEIKLEIKDLSQKPYSISISNENFVLSPGEEKQVSIELLVPASVPVVDQLPYAYSGELLCEATSGSTTIPFTFVKSPILILNFDKEPEFVDMIDQSNDEYYWWFTFDNKQLKTRIPQGEYAFICRMIEADSSKTYIVGKEKLNVEDYNEYDITYKDAKYKVKTDIYDFNNNLLIKRDYYGWLTLSFQHILGTTGNVDYISKLDTNWTFARQFRYDSSDFYICIDYESKGIKKQSDLIVPSGSKNLIPFSLKIKYPEKEKYQKNFGGIAIYNSHIGSWTFSENITGYDDLFLYHTTNNFEDANQYFQIKTKQVKDTTEDYWEYSNSREYDGPKLIITDKGILESYFKFYNSLAPWHDDYDYRDLTVNSYQPNDLITFQPGNEIIYPLQSRIIKRYSITLEYAGEYNMSTPSGVVEVPFDQKEFVNYHIYTNRSTAESNINLKFYDKGSIFSSFYAPYTYFPDNEVSSSDNLCKIVGISPQYTISGQEGISITENNFVWDVPEDKIIDIPVLETFQVFSNDDLVTSITPGKNNYISFELYDNKDNIKDVNLALINNDGTERYLQLTKDGDKYFTMIPEDLPEEFIDCKLSALDSNDYSTTFTASPAFYFGSSDVNNYEGRLYLMRYEIVDIGKKTGYYQDYPLNTGDTLTFELKYQNIGNVACENIHWNFPSNYFFTPLNDEYTLDESLMPGDTCLLDLKIVANRDESSDSSFAYFPEVSWQNGEKQFLRTHSIFNTYMKYDSLKNPIEIVGLKYKLYNNYPNPFNISTTIPFELEKQAKVNISIYNICGQLVKTLTHKEYSIGYHTARWDGLDNMGKSVCSGIYFCLLKTDTGITKHSKMILLK